ncbi:uncharacterized protein K441DRAFT_595390, partial [Cenococcum geophilum 1.58]
DIKPRNILYKVTIDDYYFRLGDFRLYNKALLVISFAGIQLYISPEVFRRNKQSPKADIWSLAITIFDIIDKIGFHLKIEHIKVQDKLFNIIREIEKTTGYSDLKLMVALDP